MCHVQAVLQLGLQVRVVFVQQRTRFLQALQLLLLLVPCLHLGAEVAQECFRVVFGLKIQYRPRLLQRLHQGLPLRLCALPFLLGPFVIVLQLLRLGL